MLNFISSEKTTYYVYAVLMTTAAVSSLVYSRIRISHHEMLLVVFSAAWTATFFIYTLAFVLDLFEVAVLGLLLAEVCIGVLTPLLIYLRNLYTLSSVRMGVAELTAQLSAVTGYALSYMWGLA